jgi:hypothetical protein
MKPDIFSDSSWRPGARGSLERRAVNLTRILESVAVVGVYQGGRRVVCQMLSGGEIELRDKDAARFLALFRKAARR